MRPEGVSASQVLAEPAELRGLDLPTHGGRLFAYVCDPGLPGLDELTLAAYGAPASTNGLAVKAARDARADFWCTAVDWLAWWRYLACWGSRSASC